MRQGYNEDFDESWTINFSFLLSFGKLNWIDFHNGLTQPKTRESSRSSFTPMVV